MWKFGGRRLQAVGTAGVKAVRLGACLTSLQISKSEGEGMASASLHPEGHHSSPQMWVKADAYISGWCSKTSKWASSKHSPGTPCWATSLLAPEADSMKTSRWLCVVFWEQTLLEAVWLTGSWCSSWVSGLCLWGGGAEFRTLVHQRPPGST